MSGARLGHIWDNIWVILSTMDNNPRCYMHLWCHFWLNHNIVAGVRYSGEAYYCIWYFSLWIFLIWSESESKRNELEWQVIFQRACSLESAKCTMYKLRCDMYDFWSGTPCPCALHLIVKDLSVKFASVIKLGVNKLKLFLARYCWNHFLAAKFSRVLRSRIKSCVSSWWRRSGAQYWAPATFSCISESNISYFLYFWVQCFVFPVLLYFEPEVSVTSRWRPFGPFDFVLHALWPLRPCDPRRCMHDACVHGACVHGACVHDASTYPFSKGSLWAS